MQKLIENVRGLENAKNVRGDTLLFRQAFEPLQSEIPHVEAMVITTLPRGSLQIAQMERVNDALLRTYTREYHAQDQLTWQVLSRDEALDAAQAWSPADFNQSDFFRNYLAPSGIRYAAAAPLAEPSLAGYPGALHMYRNAAQGPFSADSLKRLHRIANELDMSIAENRATRSMDGECNNVLRHDAPVRQFIFNSKIQPQVWSDAFETLDERLRQGIMDHARQRLGQLNGEPPAADRVPLADSRGDLWNFRVVIHSTYPALGEGPFIFFCQQPDCEQWAVLRSTDFQADNEVARLVPALKFMREHFAKGPTLVSIAKTVHLSPFHFHRRFTELLGITPKHYLLDCQIEESKRLLIQREKELSTIAKVCGFAHQSHFTSRFKQATGLTPTRWRKLASDAQKSEPAASL